MREERQHTGLVLTNASIPLQHEAGLARTFEAAQGVETVSVLTDALHGALVDIFTARGRGHKVIVTKAGLYT